MPSYTFERGVPLLCVSAFYCLHAFFALSALEGVNLAMYSAVKRCVPLVALFLSVTLLGKPPPSRPVLLSVSLISFGAFVAGLSSLFSLAFDSL